MLLSAFYAKELPSPEDWDAELTDAAEMASYHYDEVGTLFLVAKAIDENLLFPSWARSIVTTWKAAKPLIEWQREKFEDRGRWKKFQDLAEFAERKYGPYRHN